MSKQKKTTPTTKSRTPKKKVLSLKKLTIKLDRVFSEYIRRKFSDNFGQATCVTCLTKKHWREQQCGHYISRSHRSTRWDKRNVRVQCVGCNIFKKGNLSEFTRHYLEVYDKEWLQQLIKDGNKIKKWTTIELQSEIEHYTELLKSL